MRRPSTTGHSSILPGTIGYQPKACRPYRAKTKERLSGHIATSARTSSSPARRPRCRHGIARSAASPRRSHPDRRIKLPAATACRSHARAHPLQGKRQLANSGTAAPPRSATKNVAQHPCLNCVQKTRRDVHHLRFAQSRALTR